MHGRPNRSFKFLWISVHGRPNRRNGVVLLNFSGLACTVGLTVEIELCF